MAITFSDVEDIIVDTFETETDDYQAYDWRPITIALGRLRKLFEKDKAQNPFGPAAYPPGTRYGLLSRKNLSRVEP